MRHLLELTARGALALSLGIFAGCGSSQAGPNVAPAPNAGQPPAGDSASTARREQPPPPGLPPEAPFPAIEHRDLDNGLNLRVVKFGNYPIIELRLVVRSGMATDGAKTGVALIAGELLKAGGAGKYTSFQLSEKAETLGSSLDILTTRDKTEISLSVLKQDLDEALEILSTLALRPRFAPLEFKKLQDREIERVASLARTSGRWTANMVLYGELYRTPSGVHPYAHYDATPEQLKKVTLADCRSWHRQHFTPKNAFLVLAGDVESETARAAVEKHFGKWQGEAPVQPNYSRPTPQGGRSVYLVDRPESAQSDIYVGTLGPERDTDRWAALRVADQILGGGVAGRLFLDVREKRSLAYSTYSDVVEVARAPVPVLLAAGTQTAKTAHAVQALLEHFDGMNEGAPDDAELEIASRYLSDSFLLRMETVNAIAALTSHLGVMGLPDDYYDTYRKDVRDVTASQVLEVGKLYFQSERPLVVVSGDAAAIAKPLTRFGKVHVIAPEEDFKIDKILEHDPKASLDVAKPKAKAAPKSPSSATP